MPVNRLPYIANAATVIGEGGPSGNVGALFDLMRHDPAQRRPSCTWDSRLARCAQEHCEDMVKRGYFAHVTPEGMWPNKRARLAGYDLVSWFADNANNCESIGGGYATAGEVWDAWLKSPLHRPHCLGEESYASQIFIGAGYFAQADAPLFDICWAIVSCLPEVS